jgi:hypothetical protein
MIQLTQEQTTLEGDWRGRAAGIRHLYAHIPFCHRRCAYCDFNTYANMDDRMEAYVDALCVELGMVGQADTATGRHGDGQMSGSCLRLPSFPLPFLHILCAAICARRSFLAAGRRACCRCR